MSEAFDFASLVPPTDSRDTTLLAQLAHLEDIHREIAEARQRGRTAERRALNSLSGEYLHLDNQVRATPALTAAGRRAKAVHALRDIDPDDPDFSVWNGTALSALWDILQAGEL